MQIDSAAPNVVANAYLLHKKYREIWGIFVEEKELEYSENQSC